MRCEEEEEKKREKPIFCAIYPIYIKYIRFQSIKIKKNNLVTLYIQRFVNSSPKKIPTF